MDSGCCRKLKENVIIWQRKYMGAVVEKKIGLKN